MDLFQKNLDTIDIKDLESLIANSIGENRYIDYKEQLVLDTQNAKQKFIDDIVAFANTYGGLIIYGIAENQGAPTDIVGIEVTDIDEYKQKIQNIVNANIEPSLNDFKLRFIPLSDKKQILIIGINKSWIGPHRGSYRASGFLTRLDGQNAHMDFLQIKEAMFGGVKVKEKIKGFITERLNLIKNNQDPANIRNGSKTIVHIIPYNTFSNFETFNVDNFYDTHEIKPISHSHSLNNFLNIDGIVTTNSNQQNIYSYSLLFRDGTIEACDAIMIMDDKKTIPIGFCKKIGTTINEYIKIYQQHQVHGPAIINICILGAKNYELLLDSSSQYLDKRKLDRNEVQFSCMLNDIQEKNHDQNLISIFKLFLNAFGLPGTLYDRLL